MINNTTGLIQIIKAADYPWKGFRTTWIDETAFHQESVAVLLGVAIACWLDVDAITRVLLIGSVMPVMIIEILNSAVEAVADCIGSEYHRLSSRTKDVGPTAILLFIFVALITWDVLLWSHLRQSFHSYISLLFFVQFAVPKSPLAVYTHSVTVHAPRGRDRSADGQAAGGV